MDIGYHGSRFVYSLIGAGISIVIVCAIMIISSLAINPDSKSAADPSFAVASNSRNNPLTLTKDAVYYHNSITVASISSSSSSSADDGSQIITMIHPISFAEDTLFPLLSDEIK